MSMDLTGITNKNEYYTNHYFSTVFEENTRATISGWNAAARESEEIKTPWSLLRQNARQYYTAHDKFVRSSVDLVCLRFSLILLEVLLIERIFINRNPLCHMMFMSIFLGWQKVSRWKKY